MAKSLITLFLVVPVLVVVLLSLNILLAAHRPDIEKVTIYECGFSVLEGQTRTPFNVAYYLVGILFLVFDLEIAVFYPLAVSLHEVSSFGFWVGMLFLVVLTVGFVYELYKGALFFTDQRSAFIKPAADTPILP